jgi:hypothetical protein
MSNTNNNTLNLTNFTDWRKNIQNEKYVRATLNEYTFQILDYQEGSRHFIRLIDRHGKDCIHMYYDDIEDEDVELTLYGLSYKPTCLIGRDMHNGKPTEYMIKSLLIYAMKELPQFTTITFKDTSHFDCILPEDKGVVEIDLPTHNFFVYGKTWYERKFGAKIYQTPVIERKLRIANERLHAYIDIPFKEFQSSVFDRSKINRISRDWYKSVRKDITELYSHDKTWIAFFYDLFSKDSDAFITKKYGTQVSCVLFYSCKKELITLFDINDLQGYDWYISRETIESYDEYSKISYMVDLDPEHKKPRENIHMKHKLNALLHWGGSCTKTRKRIPKRNRMYSGLGGYYIPSKKFTRSKVNR